ncbi:cytochrome P450 2G1-like [Engystomops pustulosus]|uniref:cytochrome P450 2G1-like n=1 Tax=Engystomops pustulosus TaxID=76066 RepID=UPI003AFAC540
MDFTWTAILALICIFIFMTRNTTSRRCHLPPGPTPLPLIGSLLHIQRGALVPSLFKLWDQYGSVYTLYLGSKPAVVLCGYETVKEALVDRRDEFGGRGPIPVLERFTQGYGFILNNGKQWNILRNFTMKNFGFGKKSSEWKIRKEAQCVVEEFRKLNGRPVDPTKKLMDAFSNVLCSMVFGERFEYEDERFTKLLRIMNESLHFTGSTWAQLLSVLPLTKHFPGPHQRITQLLDEMIEFIHEMVKASQESLDPSAPRHFIDSFLIKMEEEKNDPDTEFHLKNLLIVTHNLLIVGSEIVSTTLKYGLLTLLKYPEIQAKLHKEIDHVIGRDREPNYDDRLHMPYTQAVINEIQRFCDVAPLNVPHMVTRDVQFRGYEIPKGTEIYPLLCTVHRDPKQFASPWKFDPNHFLDENGKFKRNDAMMAFSAGKRMCPGEALARMELFLFLTTILQSFTLTSPTGLEESDVVPRLAGFLNSPMDYELSFVQRDI